MRAASGSNSNTYILKIEDRPDYLYAYVESDSRDYEISIRYWQEIAAASANSIHSNLLVEKGTSPQTSLSDAFELVSEFPKLGFSNIRIAFVDPGSGNASVNEFAETVATNRGIVGKVFLKFNDAEKWLLSG